MVLHVQSEGAHEGRNFEIPLCCEPNVRSVAGGCGSGQVWTSARRNWPPCDNPRRCGRVLLKGAGSDSSVLQTWATCAGTCPRNVDVRSLESLGDSAMMCVEACGYRVV